MDVPLDQFNIATDSEAGHVVQMTQQENAMMSQIEDISDSMNRDI